MAGNDEAPTPGVLNLNPNRVTVTLRADRPFYARADLYGRNVEAGRVLGAGPAIMNTPDGNTEPGIVISGIRGHVVVPRADAIRLATEIADAASSRSST